MSKRPDMIYYHPFVSFARRQITPRNIPISPVMVDASRITTIAGANRYVSGLVKEALPPESKFSSRSHTKKMQDAFLMDDSVKKINEELAARRGVISDKTMSMSLDFHLAGGWEAGIMPNLDDVPISLVGKGEQNTVKIKLALEKLGCQSF